MDNLIDEIREARQELHRSEALATEASHQLRHCKAAVLKAKAALDDLLDELQSGESKYPMFDRMRGHLPTADEHQRGPTAFPAAEQGPTPAPAPAPAPRPRGRPRRHDAAP